jgi:hypothetical protein
MVEFFYIITSQHFVLYTNIKLFMQLMNVDKFQFSFINQHFLTISMKILLSDSIFINIPTMFHLIYLHLQDSVYVLASAIKDMMVNETITEAPKDCDDSGTLWETGKKLFHYLKTRAINGRTGRVVLIQSH